MNPFFIFLFICTSMAIFYWCKNASKQQGITAVKVAFILLAILLIILAVTGKIPFVIGLAMIALGLFKQFALQRLLIPLIRLLSGYYFNKKISSQPIPMSTKIALQLLSLPDNPNREQIVQAHRDKLRALQNISPINDAQIELLDLAREQLIKQSGDY